MTSTKTDGERLERMEVNLESLTKLVEAQGAAQIKTNELLQEMKLIQATQAGTLATREYVDARVTESKKASAVQRWVTASLLTIFGSIMTLLITYFITNISNK